MNSNQTLINAYNALQIRLGGKLRLDKNGVAYEVA